MSQGRMGLTSRESGTPNRADFRRACALLSLSLLVTSAISCGRPGARPPARPPAAVKTARVRALPVQEEREYLGTVIPRRRSQVGSAVDGRVDKVLVDVGHPVKARDPLVELKTETVSILLAVAKAELELRRHEYREMEAGSRDEEKNRAKAQLASAKSMLDYRLKVFERMHELYVQSRSISKEEYDAAVQTKEAAEQDFLEKQANWELVDAGPREEQKSQAKARMNVAQETVRQLEDRLKKFTIRAPFDGDVVAKFAEVGQWVKEGDLVAEVVQLDPVEVDVSIPEMQIGSIAPGDPVRIMLDDVLDEPITAKVSRIVPQADLRSRTFPIRIEVPNPRRGGVHALKAGMLARVAVTVGKKDDQGLFVHKDALVRDGQVVRVFVAPAGAKGEPRTVRSVSVQTGVFQDSWVQVQGDLKPEDEVVTFGNDGTPPLRAGDAVSILSTDPSTDLSTEDDKIEES